MGGREREGGAGAGGQQGQGALGLGLADEQGETASGGDEAGGSEQGLFEVLDGAHGDQGRALMERFGAGVEDGEAGEVEGASDFAQEGGFFAVALDEGELEAGRPILDGQAGKAGAAAEIEEVVGGVARAEVAGGEERLAEVALDHSLGRAQGGEVHALVPADEEREMDGDGIEQKVIEFGWRDKGCEQSAEGGGFHGE